MSERTSPRLPTRDGSFDYHAYLASREWALLKRAVRQRSGGVCENCRRRPATQCHHLTYKRLGNERAEDLQDVCRPCHQYLSAVTNLNPVDWCCTLEDAEEWVELLRDDPDLAPLADAHLAAVKDASRR